MTFPTKNGAWLILLEEYIHLRFLSCQQNHQMLNASALSLGLLKAIPTPARNLKVFRTATKTQQLSGLGSSKPRVDRARHSPLPSPGGLGSAWVTQEPSPAELGAPDFLGASPPSLTSCSSSWKQPLEGSFPSKS